jgi:hypothetical protein
VPLPKAPEMPPARLRSEAIDRAGAPCSDEKAAMIGVVGEA